MEQVNFRYVADGMPGHGRRRAGKGWSYFDAAGQRIADRAEVARLNGIALPPAYTDAWFCPWPDGHIQATGVDERGRKQYRYHVLFRARQEAEKYERCAEFGRALPKLRARVEADLAGRKLARDTVLAAVVRLLDRGHIRVGNEEYAKENRSFGATTLRNRHARVRGGTVRLEYMGKSGKKQRVTIEDRRLAAIVKRTQDLPGQHLFEYLDEAGHPHPVDSAEVNAYIKEATGGDFTAKHFRTWGASLLAFEHIHGLADGAKLKLKPMLEQVAAALGNTPAISRKSYVHPSLVELCRTGDATGVCSLRLPRATQWLSPHERALIGFLDGIAAMKEQEVEREAAAIGAEAEAA